MRPKPHSLSSSLSLSLDDCRISHTTRLNRPRRGGESKRATKQMASQLRGEM